MYSICILACEKSAVCTPAVVTEPRYRSRHVSGVCCRDKSGMPESRALLLCAFTPGSARVSWYISSDLATPVSSDRYTRASFLL